MRRYRRRRSNGRKLYTVELNEERIRKRLLTHHFEMLDKGLTGLFADLEHISDDDITRALERLLGS